MFIAKYLDSSEFDHEFTIVRSQQDLFFTIGCLQANSSKIVYASHFKNSISKTIHRVMNKKRHLPNLFHLRLNQILKWTQRMQIIKIIEKIIPQWVDINLPSFISKPLQFSRKELRLDAITVHSSLWDAVKNHESSAEKVQNDNFEVNNIEFINFDDISEELEQEDELSDEYDLCETVDLTQTVQIHDQNDDLKFTHHEFFTETKNKGYEIDKHGWLIITKFDKALNVKITGSLSELFKRISMRFVVNNRIDSLSCIKTLFSMHTHHFKKFINKGELDEESSKIIFDQILTYMKDHNLISGDYFAYVVENKIFEIDKISEASRTVVDCSALKKVSNKYLLKASQEAAKQKENKPYLDKTKEVYLIYKLMKTLLTDLNKSSVGVPKSK